MYQRGGGPRTISETENFEILGRGLNIFGTL